MLCLSFPASAQTSMLIPELLSGTAIDLTIQPGSHAFFDGMETATAGCNGPILGPTLILEKGDFVQFNVTNNLMDTTTMHWHGFHVAAENDGGPHNKIAPGATWSPSFEIMDHAGTYWYHPHLHMMTNAHVSKGVSGMIWVRDEIEQALDLPRTYGVDEFPMIVQTKAFDADGQIEPTSHNDATPMVNATVDALLEVPAQLLRFHVLNGASERVFNLGLEGDVAFHMIGTEGGLVSAPIELTRLRLSPGERAELVVDASNADGDTLRWMSFASEFSNGVYGATNPGMGMGMTMDGYNPNALNGTDFTLLTMVVGPATEDAVVALPDVLDPANENPWVTTDADMTRVITMTPESMGMNALNGNFLLNGAPFNMEVINYSIPLDNLEIWNIVNNSPIGHPFHIHDVQFHIIDRNGVAPAPEEQGRKDVVFVPAMTSARFMAKFEDFADADTPYMYHCHMLTHEDGGMMGQFVVLPPADIADISGNHLELPFPSPADAHVTVEHRGGRWSIVDAKGKLVKTGEGPAQQLRLESVDWTDGFYFYQTERVVGAQRILVQH